MSRAGDLYARLRQGGRWRPSRPLTAQKRTNAAYQKSGREAPEARFRTELVQTEMLQQRAASVGFDWDSAARVVEKIAEEAGEIVEAQAAGAPPEKLEDEIGDLLFAVANLARHLGTDPESALRATNAKFLRRFRKIEAALASRGKTPAAASLEEMEALWQSAKADE